MVKSKEELLKSIENLTKDSDGNPTPITDELLVLMEDISDTIDNNKLSEDDLTWKEKYEKYKIEQDEKYNKLDSDWRERYKQRFYGESDGAEDDDEDDEKKEPKSPKSFDELFANET